MSNLNETVKYTKDLSILFVEDHEELRTTTTKILEKLFKTVKSCIDGRDAFEEYIQYNNDNSKHYDIVLSDIEMPFVNGIELTKQIYKKKPSQIVIIISAFDDTEYLLELINLGIEQFIRNRLL